MEVCDSLTIRSMSGASGVVSDVTLSKSLSDSDGLMNLLEWTQHKIDKGVQIVKEMGNMLDLKFLQDDDSVNKQVGLTFKFKTVVCKKY